MNELNLIKEGGAIVPVYDYALNFDKNYQDAVNLGLNLFTGCRTISFWVKPDYTTFNGMTREFLLGQYGSSGNERTIYIEFRDTGVLRVVFETGASGGTSYLLESNAGQFFNGGQWYFVTFTIEAAGSTKIYIDGVLQSNTINHTTQLSRTGGVACLGRIGLVYPAINGNSTIKELNIWNVERSLAQVNADMTRVWTGAESGLKAYFPTNEGSGNTIQDINSIYTGTIITTNTTPNYIDDFIWVREQTGTTGGGNEKLKIDLFENQFVSVTKQSFNVNNLTQRLSGVTNNFKLPFTANNSEVFDYLDLNGNVSNKPYQINYVEYIQDGTPIIKKGRLNVKEVSAAGYKVDVTHGINEFFDRIRSKSFYEPFASRQNILLEMVSGTQITSNDLSVQNSEGVVIPLVDYGFIDPIPTYQQAPFAIISKSLEFITEDVGYTFVDSTGGKLTDLLFSPIKPFDISGELKTLSGNYILNGGDRILISTFYTTKKGVLGIDLNFIKTDISGTGNTVSFDFIVDGVLFDSYGTSANGEDNDTSPFSPTLYEIGSKLEVFMYSNDAITDSMSVELGKINYPAGSKFGVRQSDKIHYENLFKISQIDFIKNIIELLNLSIEVNPINKTVEFYNLNDVYNPTLGSTIDLSDYYSNVIYKKFDGKFGSVNNFNYEYEEGKEERFNSSIIANNTNKEKDLVSMNLQGCFNESALDIGVAYPYLMTSVCYETFNSTSAPSDTGNRIVKQVRIPNATVSYTSGLSPFDLVGDQTITSFERLDWSSLIEDNYSSLRDYVLNRYQEVKLLMRVPRHLIDSFSFQNKIFISQLNSKFVVQSIKTRPDGLSEWILIKLN